ncbi:YgfZ/GcvT domain-containing protein [Brevibacterium album]|uniref:CAF17-like 4Fe-4S cluster assembly/insertion protein YgfZ n=1 Tax=Brevibacterium album TaxID=417948 RepID=UPI0003FA1A7C|nr:glycine cleavage T C-terminal barrel domain-containing protein [Brevibacterium album]
MSTHSGQERGEGAAADQGGAPAEAPQRATTEAPLPNSLRFPRSEAVYGTGAHGGEVAHFAEPLREQRALATGRALADLSAMRVLRLTGPDRLTWLNSLTTQKVDGLAPGTSTETLVLSPTGHIEGWLRIVDDGEALWAVSDVRTGEAVDFLDRMRFMLRVEIADVTDSHQAVGFIGAPPADLDAAAVWNDPWPAIGEGSASYAQIDAGAPAASASHPGHALDFRIAVVERGILREWAHADLAVAGRDAWEALRVEAWRPGAPEVDHRALVGELDVLRTAVHLAKGCYRGQEAVARVHNLGQPPRRLVFLHLDGSGHVLPRAGAEVRAEVRGAQRAVGHVTTAALHWELGPIALALVKRSLDPAAPLQVVVTEGEGGAAAPAADAEGSGASDAGTAVGGNAAELIAAAQETIVAVSKEKAVTAPPRNADVDARRR